MKFGLLFIALVASLAVGSSARGMDIEALTIFAYENFYSQCLDSCLSRRLCDRIRMASDHYIDALSPDAGTCTNDYEYQRLDKRSFVLKFASGLANSVHRVFQRMTSESSQEKVLLSLLIQESYGVSVSADEDAASQVAKVIAKTGAVVSAEDGEIDAKLPGDVEMRGAPASVEMVRVGGPSNACPKVTQEDVNDVDRLFKKQIMESNAKLIRAIKEVFHKANEPREIAIQKMKDIVSRIPKVSMTTLVALVPFLVGAFFAASFVAAAVPYTIAWSKMSVVTQAAHCEVIFCAATYYACSVACCAAGTSGCCKILNVGI